MDRYRFVSAWGLLSLLAVAGSARPALAQPQEGLALVEVYQNGKPKGVSGLDFIHSAFVSPDGKQVYSTGNFGLAIFAREIGTGTLTFVEAVPADTGGVPTIDGAQRLAFSPDGQYVY